MANSDSASKAQQARAARLRAQIAGKGPRPAAPPSPREMTDEAARKADKGEDKTGSGE